MTIQDRRGNEKLAQKVLSDPTLYPDEFKAWLPRWMQTNVNFQLAQSQLPTVESPRLVGSTGNAQFQNGWVNFGGANASASYYKDPFGIVHVKGTVKSGTLNATIFTLPPGYRPQEDEIFSAVQNGLFVPIVVHPDGTVVPFANTTNVYVTISGITFRAFA